MSNKLETYIFTYGTLKRNFPNHHYLLNKENSTKNNGIPESEFISSAKTKDLYPLIVASSCGIPFILDKEGYGNNVHGEVFLVNEPMLSLLDELESHPEGYTRRIIEIILDDGSIKECWTYLFPNFKESLLELPLLVKYESSAYIPKHLRAKDMKPFAEVRDE